MHVPHSPCGNSYEGRGREGERERRIISTVHPIICLLPRYSSVMGGNFSRRLLQAHQDRQMASKLVRNKALTGLGDRIVQ